MLFGFSFYKQINILGTRYAEIHNPQTLTNHDVLLQCLSFLAPAYLFKYDEIMKVHDMYFLHR